MLSSVICDHTVYSINSNMPKVSLYTRKRILSLHENGFQPLAIFKKLEDEGSLVSYQSVARIVKKIKLTGSVDNLPKSGRPRKLNASAKAFIEAQMRKNDEATSRRSRRSFSSVAWKFIHQLFEEHVKNKDGPFKTRNTASLSAM